MVNGVVGGSVAKSIGSRLGGLLNPDHGLFSSVTSWPEAPRPKLGQLFFPLLLVVAPAPLVVVVVVSCSSCGILLLFYGWLLFPANPNPYFIPTSPFTLT